MTGLLTALIIILAVLTILQIIRIYELSGDLNKEKSYLTTYDDNNRQGFYLLLFGIAIVASLIWMMIAWDVGMKSYCLNLLLSMVLKPMP